jgi:DNA-binding GntR family transcriptional regulator
MATPTAVTETIALDPTAPLPLYEQLAQALHRAITTGRLAAGSLVPPEPVLAAQLGVSRQTVNQALTRNLATTCLTHICS